MAYSIQREVSDGTLQTLTLRIAYFKKEHISVYVDDKLADGTAGRYSWAWDGDRIKLSAVVPSGIEVMLRRSTPRDAPFHNFRQGAVFKDVTMDENFIQQLYINQEMIEGAYSSDLYKNLDLHNYRIKNLGTALHPTDAISLGQYQADAQGAYQQRLLAEAAKDAAEAMTSFTQAGTGAVKRTVQNKLEEMVSVNDFGAVAGQDCAAAIIAASQATTGTILVPAGDFVATATVANSAAVLGVLKRIRIDGSLAINISAGTHTFNSPIEVTSPDVRGLRIVGANPVALSITSQISVVGSEGNYAVVLGVSSTAGVGVGDYLHTTDTTGTGVSDIHRGVWKVVGVGSGNLTVKNTCRSPSFPNNAITGSKSYVLKTVLSFVSCDGFVVSGSRLDFLNNVAVVGNSDDYWNKTNVTGTEKGTHGIYVGAMTIAVNGKTDNTNQYGVSLGHVSCGPFVGVNGFDQQGVCVELSGTFWGDFVSSCNNKRRGFYASTSAGIRAKHISANGNFLDGVISDIGGQVYSSSSSCACGNGGRGVTASSQGSVIFDTGITSSNGTDGVGALSNGFVQCTYSKGENNGKSGAYAEYGGTVYCNNSLYSNNMASGIHASIDSTFRAISCTLNNNSAYGLRCDDHSVVVYTGTTFSGNAPAEKSQRNGSLIIDNLNVFGGTLYGDSVRLRNIATSKGVQIASTSAGDSIFLGFDSVGGASYTNGYTFSSTSNGFYPASDDTQLLGRSSNRWGTVFASTGTINTSDGREKTAPLSITDDVLDAWGDVSLVTFQWLDAIRLKGEDYARWHFGVIAQQVHDAFTTHGLGGTQYGLLCYDKWEAEPEIIDEEGNVTQEAKPAGDRWGIRADQCLFLEAAYQRRQLKRFEERLTMAGL